jgi:hypothetical protein
MMKLIRQVITLIYPSNPETDYSEFQQSLAGHLSLDSTRLKNIIIIEQLAQVSLTCFGTLQRQLTVQDKTGRLELVSMYIVQLQFIDMLPAVYGENL